MARQIIILIGVVVGLLIIGGGVLYAYNYTATNTAPSLVPKESYESQPDNSVLAGPVQTSSAASITITKQDGSTVTLGITPSTHIYMTSASSTATHSALVSDIVVGNVVIITPSIADATVADSIVIMAAPPTVPNK